MMSGSPDAWANVAPALQAIAARTADGPCVGYLGPGAAGNYVKVTGRVRKMPGI
jgi:6-phosphogluconate dehydrogenase